MSYRGDTICNGRTGRRTDSAILICLPIFLRGGGGIKKEFFSFFWGGGGGGGGEGGCGGGGLD